MLEIYHTPKFDTEILHTKKSIEDFQFFQISTVSNGGHQQRQFRPSPNQIAKTKGIGVSWLIVVLLMSKRIVIRHAVFVDHN